MKKTATVILLLVYLTVTTGFAVSVHYCMNKRVAVELGYSVKDDCGKCGMNIQKSKGCCKDDVRVVKMQADHDAANFIYPDFSAGFLPAGFGERSTASFSSLPRERYPLAHGPPLGKPDAYLLNCVFRL